MIKSKGNAKAKWITASLQISIQLAKFYSKYENIVMAAQSKGAIIINRNIVMSN